MQTTTFKIMFLGDGGVGKTTLIKRHLTGEFEKRYIATMGVEVHSLTFSTNKGLVTFNVWDCAGQEKFGGLREGYYIQADAAVIFGDLTSRISCKQVQKWLISFRTVIPDVPVVVCANKCDIKDAKGRDIIKEIASKHNLPLFEVSAKSLHHYERPFLSLAQSLMGDDIVFEN